MAINGSQVLIQSASQYVVSKEFAQPIFNLRNGYSLMKTDSALNSKTAKQHWEGSDSIIQYMHHPMDIPAYGRNLEQCVQWAVGMRGFHFGNFRDHIDHQFISSFSGVPTENVNISVQIDKFMNKEWIRVIESDIEAKEVRYRFSIEDIVNMAQNASQVLLVSQDGNQVVSKPWEYPIQNLRNGYSLIRKESALNHNNRYLYWHYGNQDALKFMLNPANIPRIGCSLEFCIFWAEGMNGLHLGNFPNIGFMSTWSGNTCENINIEVQIDNYQKYHQEIIGLRLIGKISSTDEDEETDPIFDPMSIAYPLGKGGTAPLQQVNDQNNKPQFIGKEYERAEGEIDFQERLNNECGSDDDASYATKFKFLRDQSIEQYGIGDFQVLDSNKRVNLILMRNLNFGCENFRLVDIKLGSKTYDIGWCGKGRLSSLSNNFLDSNTNSFNEGFRVEAFKNPPVNLTSFENKRSLFNFSLTSLLETEKMQLQRLNARQFLAQLQDTSNNQQIHLQDEGWVHKYQHNHELRSIKMIADFGQLTDLCSLMLDAEYPIKLVGSSIGLMWDVPDKPILRSEDLNQIYNDEFNWVHIPKNTKNKSDFSDSLLSSFKSSTSSTSHYEMSEKDLSLLNENTLGISELNLTEMIKRDAEMDKQHNIRKLSKLSNSLLSEKSLLEDKEDWSQINEMSPETNDDNEADTNQSTVDKNNNHQSINNQDILRLINTRPVLFDWGRSKLESRNEVAKYRINRKIFFNQQRESCLRLLFEHAKYMVQNCFLDLYNVTGLTLTVSLCHNLGKNQSEEISNDAIFLYQYNLQDILKHQLHTGQIFSEIDISLVQLNEKVDSIFDQIQEQGKPDTESGVCVLSVKLVMINLKNMHNSYPEYSYNTNSDPTSKSPLDFLLSICISNCQNIPKGFLNSNDVFVNVKCSQEQADIMNVNSICVRNECNPCFDFEVSLGIFNAEYKRKFLKVFNTMILQSQKFNSTADIFNYLFNSSEENGQDQFAKQTKISYQAKLKHIQYFEFKCERLQKNKLWARRKPCIIHICLESLQFQSDKDPENKIKDQKYGSLGKMFFLNQKEFEIEFKDKTRLIKINEESVNFDQIFEQLNEQTLYDTNKVMNQTKADTDQ